MSSVGGVQEDNPGTAVLAEGNAEQQLPPQDSLQKDPALPTAQPITPAAPAPGTNPADMPRLQDDDSAARGALAAEAHPGAVPYVVVKRKFGGVLDIFGFQQEPVQAASMGVTCRGMRRRQTHAQQRGGKY